MKAPVLLSVLFLVFINSFFNINPMEEASYQIGDVVSDFKFNGKTNSDTASMVSSYDEDMQTAREFANSSEGDTFVEKFYENAYGGISKDPKKIKDQIRKALARYKVIETNLTYIVANANKAEDRLTQADIAEAKKLTELISSKDDSEVIIEKYNLINQRIDKNFEKNAKILLRNNQETSQTLITQFGHMDSIKKHQLRLILKEKEKEAKAFEDLSADELMKKNHVSDLSIILTLLKYNLWTISLKF